MQKELTDKSQQEKKEQEEKKAQELKLLHKQAATLLKQVEDGKRKIQEEQAREELENKAREVLEREQLEREQREERERQEREEREQRRRIQSQKQFRAPPVAPYYAYGAELDRVKIFERGNWHYEALKIIPGSELTVDVPAAYRVRDSREPADFEGLTETHI